jgi:transcription termination factor NusB
MLTRHAARELSLQSLFNLDSRYDLQKATKENQSEVYENIRDSLYENAEEDEFSEKMLFGIIKNLDAINEIIIKATPD